MAAMAEAESVRSLKKKKTRNQDYFQQEIIF
jgi:hypothetical protein